MLENSVSFLDRFWEQVGNLATLDIVSRGDTRVAIADELCRAARSLLEADGACVVFREDEQVYYFREDAVAPLWAGQRFPIKNCISGWSMLHGVPVIIEDIYKDSRIPIDYYEKTFVRSLVMQPIERTRPFGAIGVYWAKQYVPPASQLRFLQALGDLAALVFTTASLKQAFTS